MHVVATAGHVDHGKSTLVRHLTGTDPDRLAEEKARGLTIDLGFAGTSLPSGRGVVFVDVPGHVRFLKNMLAGVGAVDACLFVVAATEGWKPQSEEHLRILELLGLRRGLIALTKVASVDDDTRTLARLDVDDHVAGTFLGAAEVVEVDAPSGHGLGELREALDRLLGATPAAVDRGRPRLWVDRSFAPAGAGTVVTGTLTGGALGIDDELVVEPAGRAVRVRGLQRLHERVARLAPGNRVAVNLVGVAHDEVRRGDALVRPGQWHRTRRFDASLTVLDSLDHPVSRRGAHVVYLGAGEHPVRLRILGPDRLEPGATGAVRIHLPVGLPLAPGDRFVLREAGRAETVGGGAVLDVDPVVRASRATPDGAPERVVAERGWVDADELHRLTGGRVVDAPRVGRWVVDPATLAAAVERLRVGAAAAGELGLDLAVLDERHRAVAPLVEGHEVVDGRLRPVGAADPLAELPWLATLRSALFEPPAAPPEVTRAEVRELVRRGLVVEVDGIAFAAEAVDEAARRLARMLADAPAGVTVSDVRAALGTSRKYALPLLAHLDATGRTRRRGDLRIAGPRLPAPT